MKIIKAVFSVIIPIAFVGLIIFFLYTVKLQIDNWKAVPVYDKIISSIGVILCLFLAVFLVTLMYYFIRYRKSNMFLDKSQKYIEDVSDEQLITISDRYTIRMINFKTEFLNESVNMQHEDMSILLFLNLLRLFIERGEMESYFKILTKDFFERTKSALIKVDMEDLKEKLECSYNEYLSGLFNNNTWPTGFIWYKLPLKIAVINHIRNNVENFGNIQVGRKSNLNS